jgi:hypothetical protein
MEEDSTPMFCGGQASANNSTQEQDAYGLTQSPFLVAKLSVSLCSPYIRLRPGASLGCARLHRVNNLLKVHADARRVQVLVVSGLVDELRHFVQPQLRTPRLSACARREHRCASLCLHAGRGPTCLARLPNTKSIASMTLLLPLPFGPTTEEKHCMSSAHALPQCGARAAAPAGAHAHLGAQRAASLGGTGAIFFYTARVLLDPRLV